MKSFIFLFFLILIFANLFEMPNFVGATGFSPSSLIFNLKPGEKQCKMISITSESETITADDKWAENKNVEWKVSEFNTDASSLGISINYPKELSLDEREVNVCLSGNKLGEYHGVLLLKEEQQGNSIIQMGVWLKVNIGKTSQQTSTLSASATTSSGTTNSIISTAKNISTENIETNKTAENKNKITGFTIFGDGKFNYVLFLSILVVIIIFILIIFLYKNHKEKRRISYG